MHTPARLVSLVSSLLTAAVVHAGKPAEGHPEKHVLEGTWTLVAADLLHPDGTRTRDYGEAPTGRLTVDAAGRYTVQIYKAERPRFASPDKRQGTAAEFEAAVLGSSTHFGTLTVDPVAHVLTVHIEHAAFPNWEGTTQLRQYTLQDDVLTYQVPARAGENIPLSVWRRVK